MPHLQVSATTTARSHAAALQAAHDTAVARANRVVSREPNLITTFALGTEIEILETRAAAAAAVRDYAAQNAHRATIRSLTALIHSAL